MIKNKEELKDKLYEILDKNNVSHNIFGIKNGVKIDFGHESVEML